MSAAVEAYRAERAAQAKSVGRRRTDLAKAIRETEGKRARLERMLYELPYEQALAIPKQMAEIDAELAGLKVEEAAIDAALVTLHPQAAERYRTIVENLTGALALASHAAREGIEAVRSLIQEIVVTPGAPYTKPAVEIR
ncbi:hypothetical protein A7A08_03019 [Methyloligella halotolerans]|uniref:Uncharacterized protein n=1 Tax=Methyloligella halotolerans TaxID=1177755 RepID=A0A1E2RV86_9HYPH|nr:hypothetical protein [Methyloligella halotolerans]ODA66166.1 hypothetical protein A7A08_03019 [Methyloligella halotolerans]